MGRIVVLVFLAMFAAPLGAQIISVPRGSLAREPAFVLSAAVGLQSIQSVTDGRTGTIWDFSQSAEIGASLEKSLGQGSSFGVVATYAKVPLRYLDIAPISGSVGSCCNAHVDVITAGLQFTAGGGSGFHQLVVVNAGVISFQNFDVQTNGTFVLANAPPKRDMDPRLAVAYGFSYGFAARGQVFILQEYGVALHQSDGLEGGTRRQYQQQTTRLGFRLGAGSR